MSFISRFLIFILLINNINAFFVSHLILQKSNNMIMCNENYLEKISKKKLQKLEVIKNNIEKYVVKKDKEPSFQSHYNQPIPKTTFDKLFLNLKNISRIYISGDYDRAVFFFGDAQRFVFYINTQEEKKLIDKIIRYRKDDVKVVVICDKNLFTDSFGFLFCDK